MYSAVTISGRRVSILPMKAEHKKIVLIGAKSQADSYLVAKRLVNILVTPTIQASELTLSEETDLLYLVRLMGLRNVCPFSFECPNPKCKKKADYSVDIRRFHRKAIRCGDESCACHLDSVQNYDLDKLCEDSNPRATADFSDIPENHLVLSPPQMTFTLEESGKEFSCAHLLAKDKSSVGQWLKNDDPEIVVKSLAKMVVDVDNTLGPITPKSNLKDREKTIMAALNDLTVYDLFDLRDKIEQNDGGVDSDVEITCTSCEQSTTVSIPMGASFFLPKRVASKTSSNRG